MEPSEVGQRSQPAVTAVHMAYRCVSGPSVLYRKTFLKGPTQLLKSISSTTPFAVTTSTEQA